jgi:hypothetical protein
VNTIKKARPAPHTPTSRTPPCSPYGTRRTERTHAPTPTRATRPGARRWRPGHRAARPAYTLSREALAERVAVGQKARPAPTHYVTDAPEQPPPHATYRAPTPSRRSGPHGPARRLRPGYRAARPAYRLSRGALPGGRPQDEWQDPPHPPRHGRHRTASTARNVQSRRAGPDGRGLDASGRAVSSRDRRTRSGGGRVGSSAAAAWAASGGTGRAGVLFVLVQVVGGEADGHGEVLHVLDLMAGLAHCYGPDVWQISGPDSGWIFIWGWGPRRGCVRGWSRRCGRPYGMGGWRRGRCCRPLGSWLRICGSPGGR